MRLQTQICLPSSPQTYNILNIESKHTWDREETSGFHFSPDQVPSRLRHTLPQLYKFGLNRTVPYPVVVVGWVGG